jgi:hypothetical protein
MKQTPEEHAIILICQAITMCSNHANHSARAYLYAAREELRNNAKKKAKREMNQKQFDKQTSENKAKLELQRQKFQKMMDTPEMDVNIEGADT